jgi:SNF2 family DNA or RNA helicase
VDLLELILKVDASGEISSSIGATSACSDGFNKALPNILKYYPEHQHQLALEKKLVLQIPQLTRLPSLEAQISNGSVVGKNFSIEDLISSYFGTHSQLPLLPFQVYGVDWLSSLDRAMLADDMGLGKTFQALAGISKMILEGEVTRILIICPRSLVFTWYAEIKKWTPYLSATAVIPSGNAAESVWKSRTGKSQIIITSYEQLRTNSNYLIEQAQLVVCDEAHKLRNRSSNLSQSFRNLSPQKVWFLTGTPVERDSEDFATLFSLLLPKIFTPSDHKLGIDILKSRAKPYLLRRRKSEVLKELPPMLERQEFLELSTEQARSYREMLSDSETSTLVKFGKLRHICDLDPVTGNSTKLDRIQELLEEISNLGEKAVVFSYWRKPLTALSEILEKKSPGSTQLLTSEMDLVQRDLAIHNFKNRNVTLLASAKIASEGLTLVEANHAIFINRWWNPSSNEQARDRIRRLGQQRTTYMYSFTTIDTIEEKLDEILNRKEITNEDLVNAMSMYLGKA